VEQQTQIGRTAGIDAEVSLTALERRFRALWSRCVEPNCNPTGADAAWETLARGYTEPQRRYHGVSHLDHCLHGLDLAATVAKDPDTLELAIWFHDVVNEPGAGDNERRSAEVFSELAAPYMEPARIRRICRLIMTTTHRERPEGGDERFIADIDLSSLAKPWPHFLADGDKLRAEEPAKSDEDYFRAKVRFHRALLQRGRLFNTLPFQLRCEAQGRENLQRYLKVLAELGYT
jgi:predicted metal-dependent HD superfamily phosphohydrolase